jgi:hypothetical protein
MRSHKVKPKSTQMGLENMKTLFFLCITILFFNLDFVEAKESGPLREVWESEYSSFLGQLTSMEITRHGGRDELLSFERIEFNDQRREIFSEIKSYEKSRPIAEISNWVEKFDTKGRLISKTWKFKRENRDVVDPNKKFSSMPIFASNEYGFKVDYTKESKIPKSISYFDIQYGEIANYAVYRKKSKIFIKKRTSVPVYIFSELELYNSKEISLDRTGRKISLKISNIIRNSDSSGGIKEEKEISAFKFNYFPKSNKISSITSFSDINTKNGKKIGIEYNFNDLGILNSSNIYLERSKKCNIKEKGVYLKFEYLYTFDKSSNWITMVVREQDCVFDRISDKTERSISYK